MRAFNAIGVDVGGTKIAVGWVTLPDGIVRARRVVPTLPERGGEAVLADVERLVSRFNQLQGNVRSGQDVLAAAAAGDERAARLVRSAAEALGGTIGLLVNVLDPQLVILGGGLGTSVGIYHDSLIDSARRHIWWHGHRDLPMVIAMTGPDAGLIGAAACSCAAIR